MKKVTSVTVFADSFGLRMSVTYSIIDPETGAIVEDNKRVDRVVTDANALSAADTLISYAQAFVDTK